MTDKFFTQTIESFKKFPEVDAIALGGSRAAGNDDSISDYDVYVYLNSDLSVEKRHATLSQTCNYTELNNTFWEPEDDCVLNSGTGIEVIYRSIDWTRKSLSETLEKHIAQSGYTTCICFNVFTSEILYDPHGLYTDMLKKFEMPYPRQLRENIIARNRDLLDGKMVSYTNQLEKAVKRNDVVSINHRTAEFVKSYFDILFALNEKFHPGEKKLIQICKKTCKLLPADFEKNLNALFAADKNIIQIARKIIANLDEILCS
jgi:hypothetical protein